MGGLSEQHEKRAERKREFSKSEFFLRNNRSSAKMMMTLVMMMMLGLGAVCEGLGPWEVVVVMRMDLLRDQGWFRSRDRLSNFCDGVRARVLLRAALNPSRR